MSSYSIRIFNLDYCMCAPIQGLDVMYSEFRGSSVNQVPVLRLFGSTATGKKVCVHIHGVFPYFYIPYDGMQEVNSLMYQIAASIDKAVNISLNQASSTTQHVFKISLVSGIPMYGFHTKKHQFLKIHLYNPMLIRKVSNLLSNEATLGKLYQPHETHLNFTLQFMIDYNLHGMSNLVLSEMKFRMNPTQENCDINPELFLPAIVQKVTVCELEGDALAEHIVNRQEVASGNIGANPGIAALWADEMQRRRNKGETSQIAHLLELKNTNMKPTKSHCIYKKALLERLAVLCTGKSEKNVSGKLNLSVYPAETPDNVNIQNASLVDIHTPSSLELSLNDLTLSSTRDLDDTVISMQPSHVNISLDPEAQDLLEILQSLEGSAKEDLEDDSVLSQVVKDTDEDEKELDLSMPLEAVTTPKKILTNENHEDGSDDELWDELNTTLIPQLDGEYDNIVEECLKKSLSIHINNRDYKLNCKDIKSREKFNSSSSMNREQKFVKKAFYVQIVSGRSMPLLDEDPEYDESNLYVLQNESLNCSRDAPLDIIQDCHYPEEQKKVKIKKAQKKIFRNIKSKQKEENKLSVIPPCITAINSDTSETIVRRKCIRKSTHIKTEEDIKKLERQIKRMNRQNQLIRIMRKLHEKEHKICVFLSKKCTPKFKVISKHKIHPQYNKKNLTKTETYSKVSIISDIILKTANYVDPSLHLTLKYPRGPCFLYNYSSEIYPETLKIPKNIMKHKKKLKRFIDKRIRRTDDNYNNSCKENSYDIHEEMSVCKKEPCSPKNELGKLGKTKIPTVLYNLPSFLKSSLPALDDIWLEYCNNKYEGNLYQGDLENYNYLKNMCLHVNKETTHDIDSIETKNIDESQIQGESKYKNKVLKDFIDADNKENLYIFSSKYLTDVNGDNLAKTIKIHSHKQLMECAENVKQQLERHIKNLKNSVQCKINEKVIFSKERHKILNGIKCLNEPLNVTKESETIDLNNGTCSKDDKATIQFKINPNSFTKIENVSRKSKRKSNANGYRKRRKLKTKKRPQNVNENSAKKIDAVGSDIFDNRIDTVDVSVDVLPKKDKHKVKVRREPVRDRYYLRSVNCSPPTDTKLEDIVPDTNCSPNNELKKPIELRRSPRISSHNQAKMVSEIEKKQLDNKVTASSTVNAADTTIQPKVDSKRSSRKPRQKVLPIQCMSLDGTQDSSSSDDDNFRLKRKRRLRTDMSVDSPRYSALPVSIVGSPRISNSKVCADNHLVSLNTIQNIEEKKTPIDLSRGQHTVCDINVKRKLSFSNISSLYTTVIEENIGCKFSPAIQTKSIHIFNNEYDGSVKKINSPQNADKITVVDKKYADDKNNISENISITETSTLQAVDNNPELELEESSSNDSELNRSFFRSPQIVDKLNSMLTTAEKYDKDTNFNAKEGTSKVFTPQENEFNFDSQKSAEEINPSSGSSSFDLLTPYQRIVEERDVCLGTIIEDKEITIQNSGENSDDIFSSGNNPSISLSGEKQKYCNEKYDTILIPVKKAPSREDVVKSLDSYNIPHVIQSIPFYSNVEDVTGSVEIGYNILKISSKTTAHLPEFESQSDSINNFRKYVLETSNLEWKKSNLRKLKLSFCKDRDCIIVPIKKPPTVEMVRNWIKDKSRKITTPVKKPEKIKILIPLSPGNECNDDDTNMSLTISPCTPTSSQTKSSPNILQQTPKSSKSSTDTRSPVLGHECRKRKKQLKRNLSLRSDTPSLRKSLLISQDSAHNASHQITGVTVNNTYGFDKSTENLQEARAVIEHQHLTLLVMEMHIRTRGDFKPNPEHDSVRAIFYSVLNDVPDNHPKATECKGVIAINSLPLSPGTTKVPILDGVGVDCNITYVDSEENLLNEFLKLVNYWDPDIIAGYEIEMLSWGYLIERASILGMNIKPLLARTKDNSHRRRDDDGEYGLKIVGRIVLDVWRLMRHEIALQSYTFESIVYHILQKRVPQYSFRDLSFWWDHRSNLYRHRTLHYYLFRVVTILELFDKLDLIGRTSELARLFGIQFFEVLSRGSQFRVESMMLRLAKPLNFIPVSPSVQQRANMKAPEYIALVLEPESKLYNDPVIVLDFQSLYPSIIIAYNYCFTTCIGKVEKLGKSEPFDFGATQLKISRRKLEKLLKKDLLNFSPCGVGFVKKEVRDGILPRMLREILDTRLMVKNSMKENKDEQILQKVLHNRQLGLKLIANVTYGYTAANFSGRMPSVEVGDSVVSKGRETLQRAIEMVDNTPEWGARVVYGDTDSLFVMVPGRSREYAFEVGKKIADAVTDANPDPIKLKMEKVYQPCILQTKKRYVGYMYESPDQEEPVFDAKGIETVRRDGCPAVSKMLEKYLRLLFETKDISLIKKYVMRQFYKILAGRASIQDLTFAKEYRGAAGYRPGACVPALELAKKWTAIDKRNEPRSGERVPYIIVNGPPGLPLIRLVRSPRELLNDSSLRPNALYYITRVIIPPINRCFNLIGADLNTWFNQMPRKQTQYLPSSVSPAKKSTISQYFSTTNCVACGEQTQTGICDKCSNKPQQTTITLIEKLRNWETNSDHCNLICQSCTLSQTEVKCVSLDCPVLYRRIQTNRDVQQATYVRQLLLSSDFLF